jgi:hypothetical protein
MPSDTKEAKTGSAAKTKTETKTDTKTETKTAAKNDVAAKVESPAAEDKSKSAGGETAAASNDTPGAAPANYSRGEGQKPVTAAYRENWNAIFAKKKTNRKRR